MLTVQSLLAKGYFPRELPPAFSTVSFANAVANRNNVKLQFAGSRIDAELCLHNLVRSGGVRRNLGIPNPRAYIHLCKFIQQRWKELSLLTQRSNFSLTIPVDTDPERAIGPQHNLSGRTQRLVELRASARFVLRADISRFYPSIYTHSLPWAVHSKATVKHAMATKTIKTYWADDLDTLLRNMNAKQTVGIPIGPDCSLLVAEVLLSAVDETLQSRHPWIKGIRFIDDYEFAVQQRSQAELVASELQGILSHYELALNPSKTRIIELPETFESLWTSRLRTFFFRDVGVSGQRNDLTAFFDLAFTFAKAEPDGGVLKYAVPRLNGVDVQPDNWTVLESILSQCALAEPSTLPQVCEQLEHYRAQGYSLNTDLWSLVTNQVVMERLALGQSSEAVWAMWLMKRLGISLHPDAAKVVNECEDSLAALMGLGLASVGLADLRSLSGLSRFVEPDELFGRNWLLAYEAAHQNWLTAPTGSGTFSLSPEFEFLHVSGVSFFDINAAPVKPRRTVPGGSGSASAASGSSVGGGAFGY